MSRAFLIAAVVALAPLCVSAQPPRLAFPPAANGIEESRDVQYGTSGTTSLRMDVYRPPNASGRRPALIFFNRATGADRSGALWAAWARTAASHGLIAIVPDLRDGSEAHDFRVLVPYLVQHGAELGIDPETLAVYAASGNVFTAFPAVEDPKMTAIKAAVMYYGTADITEFRRTSPSFMYARGSIAHP